MNRLLVLLLVMVLALTFFMAPDDSLGSVRAGLRDSIFRLLSDGCYLQLNGVQCHNVKIAESGIEISMKNSVYKWVERDRDFGRFVVQLESCPYSIAASDGLIYREEEKFVFRNCTLPSAGNEFKTRMNVFFVEGPIEYGVERDRDGWIFGEVTY